MLENAANSLFKTAGDFFQTQLTTPRSPQHLLLTHRLNSSLMILGTIF